MGWKVSDVKKLMHQQSAKVFRDTAEKTPADPKNWNMAVSCLHLQCGQCLNWDRMRRRNFWSHPRLNVGLAFLHGILPWHHTLYHILKIAGLLFIVFIIFTPSLFGAGPWRLSFLDHSAFHYFFYSWSTDRSLCASACENVWKCVICVWPLVFSGNIVTFIYCKTIFYCCIALNCFFSV